MVADVSEGGRTRSRGTRLGLSRGARHGRRLASRGRRHGGRTGGAPKRGRSTWAGLAPRPPALSDRVAVTTIISNERRSLDSFRPCLFFFHKFINFHLINVYFYFYVSDQLQYYNINFSKLLKQSLFSYIKNNQINFVDARSSKRSTKGLPAVSNFMKLNNTIANKCEERTRAVTKTKLTKLQRDKYSIFERRKYSVFILFILF